MDRIVFIIFLYTGLVFRPVKTARGLLSAEMSGRELIDKVAIPLAFISSMLLLGTIGFRGTEKPFFETVSVSASSAMILGLSYLLAFLGTAFLHPKITKSFLQFSDDRRSANLSALVSAIGLIPLAGAGFFILIPGVGALYPLVLLFSFEPASVVIEEEYRIRGAEGVKAAFTATLSLLLLFLLLFLALSRVLGEIIPYF